MNLASAARTTRRATLLVFLVLAGCESGTTSSKSASTIAPPETYAGSAACESCHREAYAEWKQSHHAGAQRSLRADLDMAPFDPPREIKHGTQTSKVAFRDGKYILTTVGNDGRQHDFEPSAALGVYPLWQYLIPGPGGRFQMTELAWDPDKKEWFDVYGEEDRRYDEWGHWSQRGMNWNSMCAVCHNTNLRKNYDPATDAYDTQRLEPGIGCEQCHGPMQAHVDWQNANKGKPNDPTVVKRDWAQYFSSCASCHSRRGDMTGEFRVGEKFFDHYELVLPDLSDTFYPDGQNRDEDFEIAAFTLSYMHEGGIRCLDCHSAHKAKIKMDYNDLCMRCHAKPVSTKIAIDPAAHGHHPMGTLDTQPTPRVPAEGGAGSSVLTSAERNVAGRLGPGSRCVDCHMPQTPYMMRHLRRDHGMTIPDPLLTKEHDIPNACTRCHADKTVDWSIEWVDKWYGSRMQRPTRRRAEVLAMLKKGDRSVIPEAIGILKSQHNAAWRTVVAKFLSPSVEIPGPQGQPTDLQRAFVTLLNDDAPQVAATAISALEPLLGSPVEGLLPTLAPTLGACLEHPSRLVRTKAAWALRRIVPRDSRAGRELLASLHCNQDQPTGAFRWAQYLADTGDPQGALAWYEKAIAWDPNSAPFHHAYATTLDALGRVDDAIAEAAKAARLEPNESMHTYALGLLYAEAGRMQESRDALTAAVKRDPGQARYWYNLALATSKMGDLSAAIEAMTKAEALEPAVAAYPFTRATICLEHNQPDLARAALQRVLEIDPAHQQARELLGRL